MLRCNPNNISACNFGEERRRRRKRRRRRREEERRVQISKSGREKGERERESVLALNHI